MAEIYLIRSEAKARLEKWGEAYIDLNKIRTRVGMPALPQQNVWDNYLVDLEKNVSVNWVWKAIVSLTWFVGTKR